MQNEAELRLDKEGNSSSADSLSSTREKEGLKKI